MTQVPGRPVYGYRRVYRELRARAGDGGESYHGASLGRELVQQHLGFQQTQRAGYMNDTNKVMRVTLYKELAFLGSADWAVDLQSKDGNKNNDGSGPLFVNFPPYPCVNLEGGIRTTSCQWEGPSPGIPTTTSNLVSSFSPSPVVIVVSGDTFPTTLRAPPIEYPYMPVVGVVDGSSYTVLSGTITLNSGGTSLVTGLPAPTTTTQTDTKDRLRGGRHRHYN
ncbi:hypothetical protein BDV11DRAFT_174631 [Aspergillus similis]